MKELITGWFGVDLDGTLAHYDGWHGETHIGRPIPRMLERVKRWRSNGIDVRIFTARVSCEDDAEQYVEVVRAIEDWCREHIGEVLPVTCRKDYQMIRLYDDRCVQVRPNTGKRIDGEEDLI